MTLEDRSRIRVDYSFTNKLANDVFLLDGMATDIHPNVPPDAIITINHPQQDAVLLRARGPAPNPGAVGTPASLRTDPTYCSAGRRVRAGETVTGMAHVPLPLQAWHYLPPAQIKDTPTLAVLRLVYDTNLDPGGWQLRNGYLMPLGTWDMKVIETEPSSIPYP
jgi:hypothetical protein